MDINNTNLNDNCQTVSFDENENHKISFCVAKKEKGILTKILTLDKKTNKIIKDPSQCRMASGWLERYTINSFEQFRSILEGLNKQQDKALIHGIPKKPFTKERLKLVSKAHYSGKDPGTITRTKNHICYPKEGPGIMMFDHDAAHDDSIAMDEKALQVFKHEELMSILSEVHPELKKVAYVTSPSTSSCIYNKDGEELRGEGSGAHIYVFPKQPTDIPRYLKNLGKRLFIVGYGRIEISRSGALNLRTLVDLKVGSPERLDFIGGAVCNLWPLIQWTIDNSCPLQSVPLWFQCSRTNPGSERESVAQASFSVFFRA